ncbi:hypothetical protein BBK82_02725 [Lentzea guizhouensis]|uniref:Pentapeptide repeat-containing protein n=1 Tax=Lentzea guizhouensis TaxID=1586287 RepID=A0A1B2HBN8_9PSEU|nr:hypothetical protein [Lentzea guizhouensis]ANZ35145.1 hypothetical protein BBK82_02725 [Lentzea guizhouensis]
MVDVFCSYLRLPFEPTAADRAQLAELEVRHTVQSMLWEHLGDPEQRAVGSKRWPDIDLDLSRARLVDPVLRMLSVRSLKYENTFVHGHADFSRLRVAEHAAVGGSKFHGTATFAGGVFADGLALIDCVFGSKLDMSGVRCGHLLAVTKCHVRGNLDLTGCKVLRSGIVNCRFGRDLVLRDAECEAVVVNLRNLVEHFGYER